MFGVSNSSRFAKNIADYRTENHHLITRFRKIHEYLKRFKKFETLEKKDIASNSFFSVNHELRNIVDSLDVNVDRTIELIDKLIKNLEKEKTDLDKYFSKLSNTTIENIRYIETLLINYNKDQYDMMQELNTYLPNIVELSERAIGMENVSFDKAAERFSYVYSQLEKALLGPSTKGHLYFVTTKSLRELEHYRGGFEQSFESHLRGNVLHFARNFFTLLSQSTRALNKKLKELNIDEEKDSFDDIKDDDEKFAKFMKENILEKLFTEITIRDSSDRDQNPKDLIGKIIKTKTNFKDLEKDFNSNYDTLSTLLASLIYVFSNNVNKYILSIDLLNYDFIDDKNTEKTMLFKDFRKEFVKDEKDKLKVIEAAIRDLANLNDKKTLEEFLKTQPVKKAGSRSSSNTGSSNSSFDDLEEDDKKEVVKNFKKKNKAYEHFLSTAEQIDNDSLYQTELRKILDSTIYFLSPEGISKGEDAKIYLLSVIRYTRGNADDHIINHLYGIFSALESILEAEVSNPYNESKLVEIYPKVQDIYTTFVNNNIN